MGKIYLFTFCVYIGRHSKEYLLQVLNNLIYSLEKYNNNYELQIFTNFNLNIVNKNIIINDYFDKGENHFGHRGHDSKWLNLSWNKINIYKYLYDKFEINYLWIDIDTIVTNNIEYINDVSNYLIPIGGTCSEKHTPFTNDPNNVYALETYKYIQGNIWKLDINLYNNLLNTFKELKEQNLDLMWDIQTLISYYVYFKLEGEINKNNLFITGLNYKKNVINGLSIHNEPDKHCHGGLLSLENMYWDNNKLRSKFLPPDKEIHFVGFTMYTLKPLINSEIFKNLFILNSSLNGNSIEQLEQIIDKINRKEYFGIIRPSDGEYAILNDLTLTNIDNWTFKKGDILKEQLLISIQENLYNLYIGIPCNTENNFCKEMYNNYINKFNVKKTQLTYANIFCNINWKKFIIFLKNYKAGFILITCGDKECGFNIKERYMIDKYLVNNWNNVWESETNKILNYVKNKRDELICFAGGPISKIWIPKCMKVSPDNIYLDIGSTLDVFTKNDNVPRHYTNDNSHYSKVISNFIK